MLSTPSTRSRDIPPTNVRRAWDALSDDRLSVWTISTEHYPQAFNESGKSSVAILPSFSPPRERVQGCGAPVSDQPEQEEEAQGG